MASEEIDWHQQARKLANKVEALAAERDQLHQQLAEVREELRIALAQRQDYRAQATNACALLWEARDALLDDIGAPARVEKARKIKAFLAGPEP